MNTSNTHNRAFSLVELSIVLVILGLLTGGILTGQSLIRAAELRSITTDFQQYKTAIMIFRDKYFALAGDMANAVGFWGLAGGTDAANNLTCSGVASSGKKTCNGNGDGIFEHRTESFRFWQQLANAGLIEGTYSGISGTGHISNHAVAGFNTPTSKLPSGTFSVISIVYDIGQTRPALAGDLATTYEYNRVNQIWFGAEHSTSWPQNAILKPEELWGIDKKIDDGKPLSGVVMPGKLTNCAIAASNIVGTDADYDLSNDDVSCVIMFLPKGAGL